MHIACLVTDVKAGTEFGTQSDRARFVCLKSGLFEQLTAVAQWLCLRAQFFLRLDHFCLFTLKFCVLTRFVIVFFCFYEFILKKITKIMKFLRFQ